MCEDAGGVWLLLSFLGLDFVLRSPLSISVIFLRGLQVSSFPAAMKTGSTGGSSATGASAGAWTKMEAKLPDLGSVENQTAVSPVRYLPRDLPLLWVGPLLHVHFVQGRFYADGLWSTAP